MIIELLGQPASGKSYVTEQLEHHLIDMGVSVSNAEKSWQKKSKIGKLVTLTFFYVSHFYLFLNKDFKKCRKEIVRNRKDSKTFYIQQLYILFYLMLKAKNSKTDIVILSEGIVNLSAYVYRLNVNEENVMYFKKLAQSAAQNKKLRFININVEFEAILQSKVKRRKEEKTSFNTNAMIKVLMSIEM